MQQTGQPAQQDGCRTEGQTGASAEPGWKTDRRQVEQEQLPGSGEEAAIEHIGGKHWKLHRQLVIISTWYLYIRSSNTLFLLIEKFS